MDRTDLRTLIDRYDHNALFNRLEDAGVFRPNNREKSLTKQVLLSIIPDNGGGRFDLSDRDFLEYLNHRCQQDAQDAPRKKRSSSGHSASSPMPKIIPPAAATPKVIPIPSPTAPLPLKIPPTGAKRVDDRDGEVLTTERIDLSPSSRSNNLAEEKIELPIVAPILLYLLICIGTMGALMSLETPFILSLAVGLAFSCFVPALMPPHRVHLQLGGLSTLGWGVVCLAGLMSLPMASAPEVLIVLTNGSVSSLAIGLNFMILSAGVSSFYVINEQQQWTRKMANNFSVISLLLLTSALIFASLTDALLSVIGAITGLWGITVLGDARPISLKQPTHQFAIIALGLAMLSLFMAWEANVFLFLIALVFLCGLALLAPYLSSAEVSNAMLAISATGLILLSVSLTGMWLPSLALHVAVLLLMLGQMELRYRTTNKSSTLVHRVLSPDSVLPDKKIHHIDSEIAVLGFKGAGKTSYLGALWLILDQHVTRELWYGSAKYLNDDRPLTFPTADMLDILREAETIETHDPFLSHAEPKEILEKYLQHRWAPSTMKREFDHGQLPSPQNGFPFIPQAARPTRRFLENFTQKLVIRNRATREVPEATSKVSENLKLTISFLAELQESYPIFFGLLKKERTFTSQVKNNLRCLDVPGEEVQRAVEYMDGLTISSRSVDGLLKSIETHPDFGLQKEAIRYIVQMTAQYEHVIFMVDADEFTKGERHGNSPLGAYLLLANQLAHLHGAALKRITLLLNKADVLLKRDEQPNRSMPGGGLDSWDQMSDRKLAMATVEEVVGSAILNRVQVPIEAYFTCTFGGLIPRAHDATGDDKDMIPSFPMVPINVFEPLLRPMLVQQPTLESGRGELGGLSDG